MQSLNLGITSMDNEELRLRKISITFVPLVIAPISFVWSLVYFFADYTLAALIPFLYCVISAFTLWKFRQSKNIKLIQKVQMFMILFFPFLLTWALGGFAQSGYIFLWAFFAPIIALVHEEKKSLAYWLYSFILLMLFSALIDSSLKELQLSFFNDFTLEIFTFLNFTIVLTSIYFLLKFNLSQKEKNSSNQLKIKHDALLNNTKELYDNISFLQSYKKNIDNNLIVTRTDVQGEITFANDNFYTITGFNKEETIGKTHRILRHKDNDLSIFENLWKTILSKKTWHGRLKNTKKDGSTYWIDTTISPILNKDDEIVEFLAIRHDITELIQHQAELTKMLYTDALTSLKNRNSLNTALKSQTHFSLILLNIDHFSHINNLYGEKFGDKVLLEFSKFLNNLTEKDEHAELFRLSGDEFAILCPPTQNKQIQNRIDKLLELNTEKTFIIDKQTISLEITIGISQEPNNVLISSANMAVTAARKSAINFMFYTKKLSLNDEYENNLKWIQEIKDAITDDRIVMYYQPIIDNHNPSLKKYETLIRLIDKNKKVITPYYFLEIAKKAKLYKQLTKIVLKKSFEAFKDNDYEFSINLTIEDILDKDIRKFIIAILEEYKISNRVIFEIVESESIENFDAIEKFITMVKAYGCRISIDDFGTGYSNFEHLMRLQADFIKIDGSIIKEITHNKRSALITSVIVAFAKKMNIQTIGEYVETEAIKDKLIKLGVDKSQGYFFDKPQPTLDKK